MSATSTRGGPLSSAELNIKLFVENPKAVEFDELISVFHRWIREDQLEGELPIDVAGYSHVPKGPGVVLICDHAHYYFDERAGRLGLRYRGRRVARGSGEEAIVRAFRFLLRAASLLEKAPELAGRYRFGTGEIEFGITDRLRAPSDERTFATVKPAIEAAVKSVYGKPATSVKMVSGPREPFLVSIQAPTAPSVEELLDQAAAGVR